MEARVGNNMRREFVVMCVGMVLTEFGALVAAQQADQKQ